MSVALITLRRDNSANSVPSEKEWGRHLRGEFVDISDATDFYSNRPPEWSNNDSAHYLLFVTGIASQMNGKNWLQSFQEWLMPQHEAQTHGALLYSFGDGVYQEGETVTAGNMSGRVYNIKTNRVNGMRFSYSGDPENLKKLKFVVGNESGAIARIRELEVNEMDESLWFVLKRQNGDFIPNEGMSFGRNPREGDGLTYIENLTYNAGGMRLINVIGEADPPEMLVGQDSRAESVMTDAELTKLARTKRFLPLSKMPQWLQDDFTSRCWSEIDYAEFQNCVMRHPDDVLPDRDPKAMDNEALPDDI